MDHMVRLLSIRERLCARERQREREKREREENKTNTMEKDAFSTDAHLLFFLSPTLNKIQDKDKFESTMNSAMYGNVMASAARDLQQVRGNEERWKRERRPASTLSRPFLFHLVPPLTSPLFPT